MDRMNVSMKLVPVPFFKPGSFPDDNGAAGGPRGEGNGLAG